MNKEINVQKTSKLGLLIYSHVKLITQSDIPLRRNVLFFMPKNRELTIILPNLILSRLKQKMKIQPNDSFNTLPALTQQRQQETTKFYGAGYCYEGVFSGKLFR